MTDEELYARMKGYVMGWQGTGEYIEAERRERVRETETPARLHAFDGLALFSLPRFSPPPTSDLIERQRLSAKLRTGARGMIVLVHAAAQLQQHRG